MQWNKSLWDHKGDPSQFQKFFRFSYSQHFLFLLVSSSGYGKLYAFPGSPGKTAWISWISKLFQSAPAVPENFLVAFICKIQSRLYWPRTCQILSTFHSSDNSDSFRCWCDADLIEVPKVSWNHHIFADFKQSFEYPHTNSRCWNFSPKTNSSPPSIHNACMWKTWDACHVKSILCSKLNWKSPQKQPLYHYYTARCATDMGQCCVSWAIPSKYTN